MILAVMTINGTQYRISDEFVADTNFWDAKISGLSSVRYAMDKQYGGYVSPRFGTLSLLPDLFADHWDPPISCPIETGWADQGEGDRKILFSGSAHLKSLPQDSVEYTLYGNDDSATDTMSFTSDLFAEFAAACTTLGLTLDASLTSRASSTDTNYSTAGDRDILTSLSELAAFFSHYFWIEGSTLHLADMLIDNGPPLELTEFNVLPSSYEVPPPCPVYKCNDFSVDGLYGYGKEINISPAGHTVQANVESALADIKTIMERRQIRLSCPLEAGNIPQIGQRVTLLDQSRQDDLQITMWARALVYDFDALELTIEGDGLLS